MFLFPSCSFLNVVFYFFWFFESWDFVLVFKSCFFSFFVKVFGFGLFSFVYAIVNFG